MSRSLRYITIIIHTVVWLFLFLISISLQYRVYGLQNAVINAVVNLSVIITLFYFNFFLIDQLFEKKKYFTYGFIIIVFTVAFTMLRIFFNEEVMTLPLENIILDRTVSVWVLSIFTAVFALVMSFLYQMIKNRYEKEKTHLSIINEQNEAKIQYLKAQINPHFLFNSLNNIYSLSVVKSDLTPKMVLKLSSLLRYAIYDGEQNKVPLEKEWEQIKEFIALFEMKSEEKPNVTIELKGDISDAQIEPMLLIPLVENCFKHGGFDGNPTAFAEIKLEYQQGKLHFVTRNLLEINQQKDRVGGVGLTNIRKRLDVNYPNQYSLEAKEEEGCFIVDLQIKPS